ncbi:MAG: molybdenum cofactor biosynthesis protein MoaE [Burkholderiales bacterium]|jgi:molybdopterin synthase catalytic subunit|nr:molybdenum cofactor biosynthesis protein MoaE [Burkholderiales bacterium]
MTLTSPPSPRIKISVQTEDFDVAAEMAALRENNAQVGALALFVGTVRDLTHADHAHASPAQKTENHAVSSMTLEHYPGMTERALQKIVDTAFSRFSIQGATVIHRVGVLKPTDQIVLIAVSSAHRADAFDACRLIIDFLKTEAPFWKKEETPQGSRWVEARASDDTARKRWESRES